MEKRALKFKFRRGERDQKLEAVGLLLCLVGGFVSVNFAATRAFMNDYIAFFGIRHDLDRFHRCAAFAGAVTGIYVNVKRPKAIRAMVSRGISKRLDLATAVRADKSVVVF